jgi:histidine decarboxylase
MSIEKNSIGKKNVGLSNKDEARINALLEELKSRAGTFVGYPVNATFDYSPLFSLFQIPVNNVGDPFIKSNFSLNTHEFEVEVLDFFRGIFNAPEDDFWGYVTNGGTEGNMYGLFLARELYPDGIVYYSEETHYSVPKTLRLLGARSIMIRSQSSGEMDYADLKETLLLHRDVPPIIFANIGTTMKGALDDIGKISEALDAAVIRDYYIHCDAALSGMILPFIDESPQFDFRMPVDSIAVSGHKMIGSPIPCGVVIAKKRNVDRIARSVEYIGTLDTTLAGSRNGITPVFLWYAIKIFGIEGFRKAVQDCLQVSEYTEEQINKLGLHAWRNPHSITVVFDKPRKELVEKWALAASKDIAHIITMPHVAKEQIDSVVHDLTRMLEGDR